VKISIIVAFYKRLDTLSLILQALQNQSEKDFEVIIAEDDNNEQALAYINNAMETLPLSIKHVKQKEDLGFRKNQMLNKAIKITKGEFIIFLDGDTIPHKHLVKQYKQNAREGIALYGRRVMLSKTMTEKLFSADNLKYITPYYLLTTKSKRLRYGMYLPFIKSNRETGIWGCNWGILKKHLIAINGFDEDYQKAGVGEDVDIEWRLKQIGIKLLFLKFGALTFHLFHKENYSQEDVNFNFNLFKEKKKIGDSYCKNGLITKNN
jgi:GT2 family glycosyltransferase